MTTKRQLVHVRFTDDLLARCDAIAAERHMHRNAVVLALLELGLRHDDEIARSADQRDREVERRVAAVKAQLRKRIEPILDEVEA